MVAIDPAVFPFGASFATEVDRLARDLAAEPLADGFDEILMPGERGFRAMEDRRKLGIPVPDGTRKRLVALAEQLDVALPPALA
ncbi:MAG: Ldh family oxidoreductase [Alphaproteobacteria bacterium]